MRIGIFYGVYEAEKDFAHICLGKLIDVLAQHELHIIVLDDASPSHLGKSLESQFAQKIRGTFDVVRLEQSSGFRGAMDRTQQIYRRFAERHPDLDYVLRVDADLYINRRDLSALFDAKKLPEAGLVGVPATLRGRDFFLLLCDLLPVGFRRRMRAGFVEHKWELSRWLPVFWGDIGRKALLKSPNRLFMGGAFQIIAFRSILAMKRKGWLDRTVLGRIGLIFGEDIMTTMMIKALGHPLIDAAKLLPDWSADLGLYPKKYSTAEIIARNHYLLHPLKNDPWSKQLRDELENSLK